jgi:hypothetical protein
MKKGLLLLALAALAAGGVFAQKVGDTANVFGQTYRVQESRDGRVVLQLVPTLDGVWDLGDSYTLTISGNNGVYTRFGSVSALVKNAMSKNMVKVGDQVIRNLRSTGDRTWSAQWLTFNFNTRSPDDCTGTSWTNVNFTLSADGRTFNMKGGGYDETLTKR